MESSCPLCGSPFNGETEEEAKSSFHLLWAQLVPPGHDLPSMNSGASDDDHPRRRSGNLLANGRHQNDGREATNHRPHGYTSLRDLLPLPCAPSPTAAARPQECEITIRNRLVKQAAYAYLRPTGRTSPGPSRRRGCLGFLGARLLPAVRRAFGHLRARFHRRPVRSL